MLEMEFEGGAGMGNQAGRRDEKDKDTAEE